MGTAHERRLQRRPGKFQGCMKDFPTLSSELECGLRWDRPPVANKGALKSFGCCRVGAMREFSTINWSCLGTALGSGEFRVFDPPMPTAVSFAARPTTKPYKDPSTVGTSEDARDGRPSSSAKSTSNWTSSSIKSPQLLRRYLRITSQGMLPVALAARKEHRETNLCNFCLCGSKASRQAL